MTTAIELSHVTKTYRRKRRSRRLWQNLIRPQYEHHEALHDMSFTVPTGQIMGYIGPNGAGKSTTIKLMTGILQPDKGSCRVLGVNPLINREQFVRQIGVVFGNRSNLLWDLPVIDSFTMMKTIYEIPAAQFQRRLTRLTKTIGISDLLSIPVRQMSLGQRMRCELVVALLHNPQILFLDEPTLGLDAVSKIAMHQFIRRLNVETGLTVVLTTHDMGDIRELADRIIVVGKGIKLYDGQPETIIRRFADVHKVTLKTKKNASILATIHQEWQQCKVIQEFPGLVTLEVADQQTLETLIPVVASHPDVTAYQVAALSTEEVIARFYQQAMVKGGVAHAPLS
ncbi:ATP-binding cassette domain-containing protein [Ligilactobacillus sp. LYQ139]|uniref:ABC transporter ATP-binding protein n=1 Tax=Ligilactobacillus sp. LYQ139 TaxID=3378800 RepID=UPI003854B5E8